MVEINGKQYNLVEVSGEKYQEIMERVESEFGEGWQKKTSKQAKLQVFMLAACLQADDGTFAPESDVIKLPQRLITKYSNQALELNGLDDESQQAVRKN